VAKPRIVGWLGYGGLLPFLALAALACADRPRAALWHGYLVAYGAVILSFIGALHWGFAMTLQGLAVERRNWMLGWSVVPCLIAFAALLAHSALGDILLLAGFLLHLWQDQRLASVAALPSWFFPFRLRLTAVALVCLVAGAISAVW
jgi:hypothetical protein